MTNYAPNCLTCKHFRRVDGASVLVCDAFPERIPVAILSSEDNHLTPFPGDHGIQFEEGLAFSVPDRLE